MTLLAATNYRRRLPLVAASFYTVEIVSKSIKKTFNNLKLFLIIIKICLLALRVILMLKKKRNKNNKNHINLTTQSIIKGNYHNELVFAFVKNKFDYFFRRKKRKIF